MNPRSHTTAEIRQKVLSVVYEVSGIEVPDLKMEMSLSEDIAPTSLDRVSLFMALEDEFSSSIAEEELQDIQTLQDLVDFVEQKANSTSS